MTKTLLNWRNVKISDGQLLLNIAPDVFKKHFLEVSKDICIACMELDISRILELKNKKKVGN
ncbi:pathogenicity island protein [Staphylococcus sp. HMSC056G08]|uniref:pathogenicity island protein n=1 Tax=Staphylococcus sp. HMSC056G08 TaxID=1739350 RepID=UPI0035243D57